MAEHDSLQLAEDYRRYPIDDHGKLRFQFFDTGTLTVAYAQNDQVNLFRLPPSRIRHLPGLSRITASAFGSSRTIDIGHRAYSRRPPDNDLELEDGDAFIDGLDVASGVTGVAWGTGIKFDMYQRTEVGVFMTILGGTMPIGARVHGYFAYIYE